MINCQVLFFLDGEMPAGDNLLHHHAVVQASDPALLLPAAGAGVPRQ
jgi:hypothetical protein